MITVLLADDQPLIRSAVRTLLSREEDIDVLGEAESGEAVVEIAQRVVPDVIVMDISMPNGDGIWATEQISRMAELAATRILILTTYEEDVNIFNALRAGASGFIGKGTDGPALVTAVRSIAAGESLLSPVATTRIIAAYLSSPTHQNVPRDAQGLAALTEREIEILTLVGTGLNNQVIASTLFISPLTVETHINNMMHKLGVHDRAQLVIEAYESGLIIPGQSYL